MYGVCNTHAECTAGLGSAATLWCDSGDREKAGRGLGTLHSTVLHAVVCCGSAFEFLKTNPDRLHFCSNAQSCPPDQMCDTRSTIMSTLGDAALLVLVWGLPVQWEMQVM